MATFTYSFVVTLNYFGYKQIHKKSRFLAGFFHRYFVSESVCF